MVSIVLMNQIQANEIAIEQLKAKVAEQQQVLDAVVSLLEKRAKEAEDDRAVVRGLMEHVGSNTVKGSIHGKAVRGAVRDQKQASKAS